MVPPQEKFRIAVLITIVTGILISVLLGAISKVSISLEVRRYNNEPHESQTKSVKPDRSFEVFKIPLPFDQAKEHCSLNKKSLPTPSNQMEEDELVKALETLNFSSKECISYYLGYKASPRKRYITLDKHYHLPSLDVSYQVANPNINGMCIGIQKDFCADLVPCREIRGQCFLASYIPLEHDDGCSNEVFATTCWKYDIIGYNLTAVEYVNKKSMFTDQFGLLPLNKHKMPESVLKALKEGPSWSCAGNYLAIGVAVDIELEYFNIYDESNRMKYESNRYLITDARHNCLVLKLNENNQYQLLTESCMRPSCVICV